MKLKKFIIELNKIYLKVKEPDNINVVMADNIKITKPIFKNGKIYITDKKQHR